MQEDNKNLFWVSYSDLMTSLFFIMLVLFLVAYLLMNQKIAELSVKAEELERIREIEKTVNNIDKNYFTYDSLHKKHILNVDFLFDKGTYRITRIKPDRRPELINAGKAIRDLILKFPEEENIKYLVVVEGQASKDGWEGNDKLSYYRAQSLVSLWEDHGINLKSLKNCELVVAGSGEEGVPRDSPDKPPANQRFLITIIPKIGEVENM